MLKLKTKDCNHTPGLRFSRSFNAHFTKVLKSGTGFAVRAKVMFLSYSYWSRPRETSLLLYLIFQIKGGKCI